MSPQLTEIVVVSQENSGGCIVGHGADKLHVLPDVLCVRWAVLGVNGHENEERIRPLFDGVDGFDTMSGILLKRQSR